MAAASHSCRHEAAATHATVLSVEPILICVGWFAVLSLTVAEGRLTVPCRLHNPADEVPHESPLRPTKDGETSTETPYRHGGVIGNVSNRVCIVVDDVIDSASAFGKKLSAHPTVSIKCRSQSRSFPGTLGGFGHNYNLCAFLGSSVVFRGAHPK